VLDEFVSAKLLGMTELAKWTLLKSAKGEIDQLCLFKKKHRRQKTPPSKQEQYQSDIDTLSAEDEVIDPNTGESIFNPSSFSL
jgi:hypothetical protein